MGLHTYAKLKQGPFCSLKHHTADELESPKGFSSLGAHLQSTERQTALIPSSSASLRSAEEMDATALALYSPPAAARRSPAKADFASLRVCCSSTAPFHLRASRNPALRALSPVRYLACRVFWVPEEDRIGSALMCWCMLMVGDFRDGGDAGGEAGWLCGRRCSASSPRDSSPPGTSCAASVSQLLSSLLCSYHRCLNSVFVSWETPEAAPA